MRPFAFYAPGSLPEALTLLQEQGQGGRLLAGGTDLLVQMKERDLAPRYVVSLRNVREMQEITFGADGGVTIGARVSMREIELHARIRASYPALAESAGVIGSIQVRNLATLGGNICNAAPSADTGPALIALAATALIAGPNSTREPSATRRTACTRNTLRAPGSGPAGMRSSDFREGASEERTGGVPRKRRHPVRRRARIPRQLAKRERVARHLALWLRSAESPEGSVIP